MTPLVSIIIPGYNRPGPLRYTLRSAARAADALAPASVEIIIVDDGSVPPLEEQLAGFDPGYPVVHLHQPNQGSIIARLTGLNASRGERILFLDSDDLIHPEKLTRHLDVAGREDADITYDDMAVATLGTGFTSNFEKGPSLPACTTSHELFLRIQPAPHNPVYRRAYLVRALVNPLVKPERRMDPSGDVWLYYNLAHLPARIAKIDASLTAAGPHEDARYSQHWEKLGVASLLVAESFQRACPHSEPTHAARKLAGEVAFSSWRRLPADYHTEFALRHLALWRLAPHGSVDALGGRFFVITARLLGPVFAGKLLKRIFGHTYASCRTLNDAELMRLMHDHGI
ncbi:MAG: glycosyltransferase family 2 protein [Opitutaceae bacterium]|nr:glycosyltransferase family 2 protein [Opitutaceae bacterium]